MTHGAGELIFMIGAIWTVNHYFGKQIGDMIQKHREVRSSLFSGWFLTNSNWANLYVPLVVELRERAPRAATAEAEREPAGAAGAGAHRHWAREGQADAVPGEEGVHTCPFRWRDLFAHVLGLVCQPQLQCFSCGVL